MAEEVGQRWIEALSLQSSKREKILEHKFLGALAGELWRRGHFQFSISRNEVDDSGSDVIVEHGPITRHIQLKARHGEGRAARYAVQRALATRASGCVVLLIHHPRTLEIEGYRFFGMEPGERLELPDYAPVRHAKGDSTGFKAVRPALANVAIGGFRKVNGIGELVDLLFGIHAVPVE